MFVCHADANSPRLAKEPVNVLEPLAKVWARRRDGFRSPRPPLRLRGFNHVLGAMLRRILGIDTDDFFGHSGALDDLFSQVKDER